MKWTNGKRWYLRYRVRQNSTFFEEKGITKPRSDTALPNWNKAEEEKFLASFDYCASTITRANRFDENSKEFLFLFWLGFGADKREMPFVQSALDAITLYVSLNETLETAIHRSLYENQIRKTEASFREFLEENEDIFVNHWEKTTWNKKPFRINLEQYGEYEKRSIYRLLFCVLAYSKYETTYLLKIVLKMNNEEYEKYRKDLKQKIVSKKMITNPFSTSQINAISSVAISLALRCFSESNQQNAIDLITTKPLQQCVVAQAMRWSFFKKKYLKGTGIKTVKQYYTFLKEKEAFSINEPTQQATKEKEKSEYEQLKTMTIEEIMQKSRHSPDQVFRKIGRYLQAVKQKSESKVDMRKYLK